VALVLGVAAYAGDSVAQRRELDRLIGRVLAAQDTIAYTDHRVAATVDYTLPLLFSASVPARVRSGLQQLVADSAAGQVGDIEQERVRAADVFVLPWHRALRRAKAALIAYLEARVKYLRAVAKNTQTLYVVHPELDRMLDATRRAFRVAAGPTQRVRIDAAFTGGRHST
jgi:hypothetical protein